MESNIIISSDSTCDLSAELIERYHIEILPLGVVLGDRQYRDGVDITPADIFRHHDVTGQLPKTNATNLETTLEFFKQFTDSGKTVIHFTVSSEMSSNFNNARMAAEELENVFVIDSKNLSTGVGLLVVEAAEMAQNGAEAEAVVAHINELVPCVDASFVIDSLDYLHKGGRCSAVAVFGANLMKIKPCIQVKNGAMGVAKKYRGKFEEVIKQYIREQLSSVDDIRLDRAFVTLANPEYDPFAAEMVALVKELLPFKEVFITHAGCTICSHCGPKCLGVLFIRKSPLA